MNAISLFSGVGGLDLGFQRAGIETVLQAERDPWCLEVLTRHWPETERVNDVRDVGAGVAGARGRRRGGDATRAGVFTADAWRRGVGGIDLVYGGFPCQDLSVAGKRAGLGGERSGLWYEFHRVLSELRPRWAVIENVPGLLSSGGGRDFGIILDGLDELGFDVAWAILDAQHFGVPQRRRRVFIVAGPRGRGPEQVLSLCEGCGGNPATGRAAGESVAGSLEASTGGPDDNDATSGRLVVASAMSASQGHHGHTLDGARGQAVIAPPQIAWALQERDAKGVSLLESQDTFIIPPSGVRRLTPLECNRLQGFPDDWDRFTGDGREIADSHRYRMMGNAVAVPVAEWLGHRLVAVDGGTE